jgi:membrane-bound metal-dependent hydrolase YbcI (DUF457 family)
MGQSHLLSGTAVGLAVAPVLTDGFVQGLLVVGVCTASAGFPDIDHPKSLVTRSLGPVTRVLSWVIRLLTKHRGFTHSVIGIVCWVALLMALGCPDWLAMASGIGCATHVLGDALTTGGVWPLWPSKFKLRLTSMKAGGAVEKYVVTPLLFVACGWFTLQLVW